MNIFNQYELANHYYDLTDYIDKNIYKFKRNGKYLQENWLVGVGIAAGIGLLAWLVTWLIKKNKNKKDPKVQAQQVKQKQEELKKKEEEINTQFEKSTPEEQSKMINKQVAIEVAKENPEAVINNKVDNTIIDQTIQKISSQDKSNESSDSSLKNKINSSTTINKDEVISETKTSEIQNLATAQKKVDDSTKEAITNINNAASKNNTANKKEFDINDLIKNFPMVVKQFDSTNESNTYDISKFNDIDKLIEFDNIFNNKIDKYKNLMNGLLNYILYILLYYDFKINKDNDDKSIFSYLITVANYILDNIENLYYTELFNLINDKETNYQVPNSNDEFHNKFRDTFKTKINKELKNDSNIPLENYLFCANHDLKSDDAIMQIKKNLEKHKNTKDIISENSKEINEIIEKMSKLLVGIYNDIFQKIINNHLITLNSEIEVLETFKNNSSEISRYNTRVQFVLKTAYQYALLAIGQWFLLEYKNLNHEDQSPHLQKFLEKFPILNKENYKLSEDRGIWQSLKTYMDRQAELWCKQKNISFQAIEDNAVNNPECSFTWNNPLDIEEIKKYIYFQYRNTTEEINFKEILEELINHLKESDHAFNFMKDPALSEKISQDGIKHSDSIQDMSKDPVVVEFWKNSTKDYEENPSLKNPERLLEVHNKMKELIDSYIPSENKNDVNTIKQQEKNTWNEYSSKRTQQEKLTQIQNKIKENNN